MRFKPKTKLRILVLLSQELMPPDTIPEGVDKEKQLWRTEYDVISTLKSMGHDVYPVGLRSDLAVIANAREEHKPQIAFNLLEDFEGQALFDQHVVSYLELLRQPYTGCNPRGLTIAHDKALTKKILSYHRIAVPGFAVFPLGQKVWRPRRLAFPLFVKSIAEEGSVGIAQGCVDASVAYAAERRQFGKPIAAFQLVQELIADMAVETEAARLLAWRAAYLADSGQPYTLAASQAKYYASEVAVRAANAAVQVHGGYGYVDEFPVQKYLRDARVSTLYEGTSQIQKLLIGRALTGESAFI